jgi:hypothetical protein
MTPDEFRKKVESFRDELDEICDEDENRSFILLAGDRNSGGYVSGGINGTHFDFVALLSNGARGDIRLNSCIRYTADRLRKEQTK